MRAYGVNSLLIVLTASLLACAVNPATQQPVLLALTERQEVELGQAGVAVLSVTPGIWEDERLTSRVQRLGAKIASIAPGPRLDYEFHVLDTAEKNAFALPGGFIFVSRGLLAVLEREDELVATLAHEVGHVVARHASRRAVLNQGYSLLNDAARALAGLFEIDLGDADRFLARTLASHSRSQELEADRIGVVLTVSLGYDGSALAELLERLEAESSSEDRMLDTHPSTPERRRLIYAFAPQLAPGPGLPELSPSAFVRQLDGLPMGPGKALGHLDGQRYLAPGLAYVVEFPEGWELRLSLDGPVASSPDWQAVLSVYDASGTEPPTGPSRPLGPTRVFTSTVDGMRSARARITLHGRDYEVAGLWAQDSKHRAAFDAVVESMRAPPCAPPLRYETSVLEVHSDNGTLEKRLSERRVEATPDRCR